MRRSLLPPARTRRGFCLYVSLSIAFSFLLMILTSGMKSVLYDDIYQIYFVYEKPFSEMILHVLTVDLMPPLFACISWVWLKVAPIGLVWLRLPSMLAVSGGVLFTALAGKEAGGRTSGVWAGLIAACSPFVLVFAGHSFRVYGFCFLFAASTLYLYLRRLRRPTAAGQLLFAFSMTLMVYTHYFGVLLCILLGVADLWRFLRKRAVFADLAVYLIPAALLSPWLFSQLTFIEETLTEFWPAVPTLGDFFFTFFELFSWNGVVCVLWAVSALLFIVFSGKSRRSPGVLFAYRILIFVPLALLVGIFVYSAWIRPEGSVWVSRYFLVLVPAFCVWCGVALPRLFRRLFVFVPRDKRAVVRPLVYAVLTAGLLAYAVQSTVSLNADDWEPYATAGKLINDYAESEDGRILIYLPADCGEGFFYFLTDETREKTDLVDFHTIATTDFSLYDVIYVVDLHWDIDDAPIVSLTMQLAGRFYRDMDFDPGIGHMYRFYSLAYDIS